jgi:hypothetical protein
LNREFSVFFDDKFLLSFFIKILTFPQNVVKYQRILQKTMPKPSKEKRQSERGAVKAPCEKTFASHLVRRPGGPGRVLPLQSV